MEQSIVVSDQTQFMPIMSIQQVIERRNRVVEFTKAAMVAGRDFGAVPGTDKPTLLKPGAEKLCTLFGLTPTFTILEHEEDWTGERHGGEAFFYYLYKCKLWRGDLLIAEGDGSCNSFEKKYRWRQADRVCPNCGKPAIKRSKFPPRNQPKAQPGWYCYAKVGGCGAEFVAGDPAIEKQQTGQMPNPDVADVVNTIQKMSQKRALIAATLLAVNASEFYTQDLDDLIVEGEWQVVEEPVQQQSKTPSAATAQPTQNGNGHTAEDEAAERQRVIDQLAYERQRQIEYGGTPPRMTTGQLKTMSIQELRQALADQKKRVAEMEPPEAEAAAAEAVG